MGNVPEITAKRGQNTGGHLYKMLNPGLDTCYLRFYVKFDEQHGYIHHFMHLVGYNPPTRYPQGGAGEKPRGDERFSTGVEPWGFWGKFPPPGAWNLYSYWCEMKDSPDGKYWGNSFAPEPPQPVQRGKWICMEVMLKCNSAPDKSDGQQALDRRRASRPLERHQVAKGYEAEGQWHLGARLHHRHRRQSKSRAQSGHQSCLV